LKLKVEVDSDEFLLEFQGSNSAASEYALTGSWNRSGHASIAATMPGVFSVLLDHRSFMVAVARRGSELEVWAGGRRHTVSLRDPRDRSGQSGRVSTAGPVEIRAQMPGKVIKVLVETGASVETGEGVIIVEAMKMQNEMKSPKTGVIRKIHTAEGATVIAGEALMVIE
jgi:biotin carboxyl carrier protein